MSGEVSSEGLDPAQRAEAEASVAEQEAAAAVLPPLLAAARDEGAAPEHRRAFWEAVFRLPHWIFVARGESDSPAPLVVYAGPDGQTPTMLAFSRPEDAVHTARAAGLSEEESSLLLAVPMPAAAEWAASFAQSGVRMLQVEAHDEGGLVIPLEFLPRMRADLLGG
ncbi:hypothetical protein [Homoserinibacter sp. YIM 151385]|uniref:hypothetical protein n=1 Tax=Homoserinibacter sp. YIM 151385 TaxID=2985506 RepID=UPI0022F0A357|nr:hypothetical protein [Homoserinibacter sp. YIM 151385]WBU37319.1 hypothetical protein OF852_10380 [Homoserinibacter sp. YIM 151385]